MLKLPLPAGLRLQLVGVAEPQHYPSTAPAILREALGAAVAAVDAERRAAAEKECRAAADIARGQDVVAIVEVGKGRPAERIVQAPPYVFFMDRWDDALLACEREGLVQHDDVSDPSPRLLARNACAMPETSQGRVALDVDFETLTGSLVLERALKLGLDCGDDPAFIRFDEKRRGDHRAIEQEA